ncbi:MFS transporter [Candidatus Bathyarchaeota archaeon]|nr:MFS transporter [Candidatus Bathyarchaeota archaeon]MBS7630271.1 MFS transporter [Candidatus Bathyarchaeota archaeon]
MKANPRLTVLNSEGDNRRSNRLAMSGITISHFAQHLYAGSSILYNNIMEDLNLNYTQIGMMVGIVNILGGFLQIVYSVTSRWVSRRLLLVGSNFALSIGSAITGVASCFEGVLAGKTVIGIGQAGIHPVSSSIISSKFDKRLGSMLSIFYGLGYVGNIVSPILLSSIALFSGWRNAFLLLTLIFFFSGLIVFSGLRGEASADRISSEESGDRLLGDVKAAFKVRGAIPILIAQAFISGGTGMGVMTTWIPVFLRDSSKGLNLTVGFAGIITSLATIGGVLGTLYLGRLGDQHGYLKIALISLSITTVTIFLLTAYKEYNILLIPHLFILSMTTFSMSSLLQAQLVKNATHAEKDVLLGFYFTFGFGVSALWSTLLGALIDSFSFNAIWLTMVGAGLAAQICLIFSARSQRDSNQ